MILVKSIWSYYCVTRFQKLCSHQKSSYILITLTVQNNCESLGPRCAQTYILGTCQLV